MGILKTKSVIITFAVTLVLVLFYMLFLDAIMKAAFIKVNEVVFGAKTEVDHFNFSLKNFSIEMRGYRVADKDKPMQNLFEIGRIHTELKTLPLLEKKVVSDELAVTDISFGTARKKSGALKKKDKKQKEKKKKGPSVVGKLTKKAGVDLNFSTTDMINNISYENMIDPSTMHTLKAAEELKKKSEERKKYWEEKIPNLDPQPQIDKLNIAIEDIKKIDKIETPEDIVNAKQKITNLSNAKKELSSKMTEIKTAKQDLTNDKNYFTNQIKEVKSGAAKLADYNEVFSKLNFDQFGTKNMSKQIFGKKIVERIDTTSTWITKIRSFLPKKKESEKKKKEPRKSRDKVIAFPKEKSYPTFLIKQINVSGNSKLSNDKIFTIAGKITGVTSDQNLAGMPTVINLTGKKPDEFDFKAYGMFDHRGNNDKEEVKFNISNLNIDGYSFGTGNMYPPKFKNAETNIDLNFTFLENGYITDIDAKITNIIFDEIDKSQMTDVEKLVQDVYADLKTITLKAEIKNIDDNTDMTINTNLDEYLNSQVKNVMNKQIEEAKSKVRAEIDKKINESLGNFDEEMGASWQSLGDPLARKEALGNLAEAEADKQVEKYNNMLKEKAKNETKKLQGEATKALKSLFK